MVGSANAGPLTDLAACYTRAYTDAHLADEPKQNVRSLALQVAAQDGVVILSGTNLLEQLGYLVFNCDGQAECGTFEKDSQLWIDERDDETIVIKTRNAVLSDIGEDYSYVEDNSDNHAFYLEDNYGYHFCTIGSVKLQRGIERGVERRAWAVFRKRTLAAPQKISRMGSNPTLTTTRAP
jgi:hypothetical protein